MIGVIRNDRLQLFERDSSGWDIVGTIFEPYRISEVRTVLSSGGHCFHVYVRGEDGTTQAMFYPEDIYMELPPIEEPAVLYQFPNFRKEG